jgi:hypothetical protein
MDSNILNFLVAIRKNSIDQFKEITPGDMNIQLSKFQLYEIMAYFYKYLIKDKFLEKQKIIDITKNVIGILENVLFFEQNILLYKKSFDLVIFLNNKSPDFITNEINFFSSLVTSCLLVHKYYIDNEFENSDICKFFSIELHDINKWELEILIRLNFTLPFQLDFNFSTDENPSETHLLANPNESTKKKKKKPKKFLFTHIKNKRDKINKLKK